MKWFMVGWNNTALKELKDNMMNSLLGIILLLIGADGIDSSPTDAGLFTSIIVSIAGLVFFWVGANQMVHDK